MSRKLGIHQLGVHTSIGLRNEMFLVVVAGQEAANSLNADDEVELLVKEKLVARGLAVLAWTGPMRALPAFLIENHHDPAARSYSGLCCLLEAGHELVVSAVLMRPAGGAIKIATRIPT